MRLSEIIADTNWAHPRAVELKAAAEKPCDCIFECDCWDGSEAVARLEEHAVKLELSTARIEQGITKLLAPAVTPKTTAAEVFSRVGFTGPTLDVALGVAYAESSGFVDAVGDVTLVDAKWGPSIGLFQVRSLRNPMGWAAQDRYRYAWALRDADFNAQAAFIISAKGANWSPWSVYRSGAWEQYAGRDFTFRVGHSNADLWNL